MKKKMKIGFVVDDTLDKTDGVQQYVLTLGKWLSENGHEIHFLVGETKRTDLNNIHSLSRNFKVRFNKNRLSIPLPANTKKLKNLLLKEGFDIIHIQMPYSPWLAGKIIKQVPQSTAVIGTFHILPYGRLEKLATRLLGAYSKKTLQRFDQVLSVSLAAQKFCLATYKTNSLVLPNTVATRTFRATPQASNKFRIVYLNRLVPRKGCAKLIEAVKYLPAEMLAEIEVIIIGKGPLRQKLEAMAKGLPVKFLGFVEESLKPRLLASADIAVFPSLGGESFGIVLIEAMAAGAGVVIGGNNAGYKTVLDPVPETLFNPNKSSEFTKLLRRLWSDEKLRQEIHKQQKQIVKQYDVEVVGSKLLNIYAEVIDKKGQSKDND